MQGWLAEYRKIPPELRPRNLRVLPRDYTRLRHPRAQVITKTDLAKYAQTFRELPHEVSLGAQKNFRTLCRMDQLGMGKPSGGLQRALVQACCG